MMIKANRKRIDLGLMALEPRWMFDGAAAVDAAHAAPDVSAKALIPDAPAPVQVRAADPTQDGGKKEVVFVDTSVAGYQTLEAAVKPGIEIEEIDGGQSGLAQIAKWAETHTGYDSISILSHGAEGAAQIGTDTLRDASLSDATVQAELAQIGHSLNVGGDLLLYGRDATWGSGGRQLADDIAGATGATVGLFTQASDGSWQMAAATGPIELRGADPSLDGGRTEVVFIDTSVDGYQGLVAAVNPGVETELIDGSRSGLAQIAKWAETHTGYDSISILSHGAEGLVRIGSDMVTDASLSNPQVRAALEAIGRSLKPDGDLLLYGCDVAKGDSGQTFINDLAAATGADVAASSDSTGAGARGGNWVLERSTGTIDATRFQGGTWDGVLGWAALGSDYVSSLQTSTLDSAVDSNGTPYIMFRDLMSPQKDSVYKWNGTSWVAVGGTQFTATAGLIPQMAIPQSGTYKDQPFVVYSPFNGSTTPIVTRFDGTNWVTVGTFPTIASGTFMQTLNLAFNSAGSAFVAYSMTVGTTENLYVRTFDGTNWTDITPPSINGYAGWSFFKSPSMAFDSNNNLYLAFSRPTSSYGVDGNLHLLERTAAGSWVSVSGDANLNNTLIATLTSSQTPIIKMAVDTHLVNGTPANTLYVAYVTKSGSVQSIYVTKFNGTSWNVVGGSATAVTTAATIDLMIDPTNGTPYVTYNTSASNMGVMKFDGTNWVDSGPLTGPSGATSKQFGSLTAATNGTLYLAYAQQDSVGYQYPVMGTFTAGPAAPSTPTLDSTTDSGTTGDGKTNYTTPVIKGTGVTAGATVTLYKDGVAWGSTVTADGSGNWTFTAPSTLADATYAVTATQTTGGQTSSASSALSLVIDTAAPVISNVTLNAAAYKLGDTVTATVASAYDGKGAYTLTASTVDGASLGSWSYTTGSGSGTASFTVGGATTEVINGNVAVNIVLTDAAGNSSTAYTTAIASKTIDTHAPTDIAVAGSDTTTHAYSGLTAGTTVGTLSTTDASPGETFTYTLSGADAAKFQVVSGVLKVAGGQTLAASTVYNVTVQAQDLGGNTYSKAFTITGAAGPAVTVGGTASYTERAAAAALENGLSLTDGDTSAMTGATVSISAGLASGDTLACTTTGTNITASYAAGTLTLSGNDTLANYQQVLKTVTFANPANHDPTAGSATRTISWQVHDQYANGSAATTTLTITPVNDSPSLTASTTNPTVSQASTFTANLFSSAAADPIEGSQSVVALTLTVSGVVDGTAEILKVDGTNIALGTSATIATANYSVDVSYSSGTATLTITKIGNFTASAANTLINALQYENTNANATTGARQIKLTSIKDSSGDAASETTTINITTTATVAANDTPVVNVPGGVSATEEAVTQKTISGVSVTDTSGGTYVIVVSTSATGGKVHMDGITPTGGANDSNTVTFQGTRTQINTALATLKYTPGGFGTETITVGVDSDGGGALIGGAKGASATITVTETKPSPPPPAPSPPPPAPPPVVVAPPAPPPVVEAPKPPAPQVFAPLPPITPVAAPPVADAPKTVAPLAPVVVAPPVIQVVMTQQFTPSTADGAFRVPVVTAAQGGPPVDGLVALRPEIQTPTITDGPVRITLPLDAFAHTRSDAVVTLNALRVNGQPLPQWLNFDSRSGTLAGQPPADFKGTMVVRIIARDDKGQEATITVRINGQPEKTGAVETGKAIKLGQHLRDKPGGKIAFTQQLKLAARNAAIRFS